jgi:sigma-B regulation protein RsbU (phosphoserine phosphatase)
LRFDLYRVLAYNRGVTENGVLLKELNTLNRITDTLNRTDNIHQALDLTLTRLVDMMKLQSGWVFLRDPDAQNQWAGRGYVLEAHYNLPPALTPGKPTAWKGGCDCQALCDRGKMNRAYNEVRCSRLANTRGDKRGLTVHASTPLNIGDRNLGILNVAGPDWSAFSEDALAILTNVGSQMGVAIERARLFDMVQQQRIHEQAALLSLSGKLLESGLELDDLMVQVTREVRDLLQVDACALLFPNGDPNALSFFAAAGWHADPVAGGRQIPADERSGPGLVMQVQEPLIIEDLRQTERMGLQQVQSGSPEIIPASWTVDWLQGEGFRGHAVVPLIVEARSIGVMVINTRQPRLFHDGEVRFLRLMANQAAIAIEKARLIRERIQRERLEEELAIGQRIQLSLLPESNPQILGWEFATHYGPARQIGGDYYDFFQLTNKGTQLGMVIADVSGKGVSAALFMALSRSIIRTKAFTGRRPWEVLRIANRLICKDSRSNLFITAFYATLDTDTGHLVFTNAGHNRPVWLNDQTGHLKELATEGIVLGVFERIFLGEDEIDMGPNDLLVLYTDGVTEAMTDTGELYGLDRLYAVIKASRGASAQSMLNAILQSVHAFTGDTPHSDDLTLFVVKRLPEEPPV